MLHVIIGTHRVTLDRESGDALPKALRRYQVRQDSREMKTPCPAALRHVIPVLRDVQAKPACRQVAP
jgi:hypothetical protein